MKSDGKTPFRRRLRLDAILAITGLGGLVGLSNAASLASAATSRTVFEVSWLLAVTTFAALAARMSGRLFEGGRRLGGGSGERGAAALEMTLVFPMFLLLVSMVVQMSLLAVATLVTDYAAFSAARSAVVSLAADRPRSGNVRLAAAAALAPISPPSRRNPSSSARRFARLTRSARSPWHLSRADRRFQYAYQAIRVKISPNRIDAGPSDVNLRLSYDYRLVAPPAALLLAPRRRTVSGVRGHFLTIPAACELRSTGSRSAGIFGQLGGLF